MASFKGRHYGRRLSRVCLCLVAIAVAGTLSGRAEQQPRTIEALLDDYLAGRYDAAMAGLRTFERPDDILDQLKRSGRTWVDAGDSASAIERRRLAAATLALEAARPYTHHTWKIRRPWPPPGHPGGGGGTVLEWRATPLLIEWGCELLRQSGPPTPGERLWQLAATGVASRSGDHEFLIGDPEDSDVGPGPVIGHLGHAHERFPDEPRLKLAEAIVAEWRSFPAPGRGSIPAARRLLQRLQDDPDVGAEATLRLGYGYARQNNDRQAVELFDRVDVRTRDPWLMYLARYFKGRSLERQRRFVDAEAAYRDALVVIPGASSATLALAARLTVSGRTADASALVAAMTTAHPQTRDPWREYVMADDRFWPDLIARLRARIRQ